MAVALHLHDDLAAPDRCRVERVDVHAAVVRALGRHGLHPHGPEEIGDQFLERDRIHGVQVRFLVAAMGDDAVADISRAPARSYGSELVRPGRELPAQPVGQAAARVHLRQVQFEERGAGGHDRREEDVARPAGRGVVPVHEAVQDHRLECALFVRPEEFVQHEQGALCEDLPVQAPALGDRTRGLLVLIGPGEVPDGLHLGDDSVGGQFPVEHQLPGRGVVGGGDLPGKALRPRGRGVQGGGEVLDHGVGFLAANPFADVDDTGVVPTYVRQLGIGPLLVLPLVGRQLPQPVRLRGLGRVPVPLEAGL